MKAEIKPALEGVISSQELNAIANLNLGLSLLIGKSYFTCGKGDRCEVNYSEARMHLEKAYEQESFEETSAIASLYLSTIYLLGLGVKKNESTFVTLRDKAIQPLCKYATRRVCCMLAMLKSLDNHEQIDLHIACSLGFHHVAENLLSQGADIYAVDKAGKTCLHEAGSKEVVELLVKRGLEVNSLSKNQVTPLHFCSRNHNRSVVDALLAHGALVNTTDYRGCNAFLWAVQYHDLEAIKVLMENKANVKCVDNSGRNALHYLLMEIIDDKHEEEIVLAILKILLVVGVDRNIQDKRGRTVLHDACRLGFYTFVKELISNNIEVNSVDEQGFSPLHHAVRSGEKATVELLLAHDANVKALTKCGKTPLHFALEKNDQDIMDILSL